MTTEANTLQFADRNLTQRVQLNGPRMDALKPLLFGTLPPRASGRQVVAGESGQTMFDTYILIEAAKCGDAAVMLEGFGVPHCSLYQGPSADAFARHAPYLARIDKDSAAAEWAIDEGWDAGWGVWLRSARSMDELRKHFRKFTQLYNPEDERWYIFRFYAPETMRRIVPSLSPSDFAAITQGIGAFIVPSTGGDVAVVI